MMIDFGVLISIVKKERFQLIFHTPNFTATLVPILNINEQSI